MQLSLLATLYSAVVFAEDNLAIKQNLACHGKDSKQEDSKKSCFCPGSCFCGKGGSQDKYPKGVCPEQGENVYTKVHTETCCVTNLDVHTSQETVTKVIDHLSTATNVIHPENVYTLTRTESYVVWPAQTSTVPGCYPTPPSSCGCEGPCDKSCEKKPCDKHGKKSCCICH